MKLLILGAGGHGKVVREVAEAICDIKGKRIYSQIDFLDSNSELERYRDTYECTFVDISRNHIRRTCLENFQEAGFQIPVLI